MSELTEYKKPELIKISQLKKLCDYAPADRLAKAKELVKLVTGLLGTHDLTDESMFLTTIKYLCENEKNYTPEQIKKAFSLAIEGKLNVKLEKTYSARLHGLVMVAFSSYYKEVSADYLRKQRQSKIDLINTDNQLSREEKLALVLNGVDDTFKDVHAGNKIIEGRQWVADWLEEQELVEMKVKEFCYHSAHRKATVEMRREKVTANEIHDRAVVIQKYEIIKQVMKQYTTLEQLMNKAKHLDSYKLLNGKYI